MAQSLIVPIDIAALCVGDTDVNGSQSVPYGTNDFARLAADFSMIPWLDSSGNVVNQGANVTENMLAAPFDSVGLPLQRGIHLHWALPDALSHGASDAVGNIAFPEAPNRWLVVRTATNNAAPTAPVTSVMGWIVESDTLWATTVGDPVDAQNALSRAVPIQPIFNPNTLPNQSYQMMGRVYAYATWTETPGRPAIGAHTALGYGIPSYAATYPHCPNVFGLYDLLADLDLITFPPESTRISYMVTGWYSSPTNDPLATMIYASNATNADKVVAINNAFKWNVAIDDVTPFPASTLCSGMLTAITWDPAGTHYINPRPETPIDVAIGNTTAEALSALIAASPQFAGLPAVERVLNALQLNLLANLGAADGLAMLEEALHRNDFGATGAGRIWTIKRRNAVDARGGDPVSGTDLIAAAGTVDQPLPLNLAIALDTLNALQARSDRTALEIDTMRGQIFADWYKYMILEYPTPVPQPTTVTPDQAFHFIKDEVQALDAWLVAQAQLADELTTQIEGLFMELEKEKKFILSSIASPRNWHAAEPVLLLSGADARPSNRNNGNGQYDPKALLLCRLSGALVDTMEVTGTALGVRATMLPGLPASPNISYTGALDALMAEVFFLDTNQAWTLAAAVAAQGGAGNPAVADLAAFVANVQAAQSALLTGSTGSAATGGIGFTGVAPSPVGFNIWSSPWIPLMMQWEANYYPFAPLDADGAGMDSYVPDFITSNYLLDDDSIDLVYRQPVPAQLPVPQVYRGTALLTGNTEINITSLINLYILTHPGDAYNAELEQIRDSMQLPMMAQTLDGFNHALMMRRPTLQLPVFDPLGMINGLDHYRFSNTLVRTAVGDSNNYAPMPLFPYNPLRAGYMTVSRVRIVDAFGQVREIDSPNVIRSETLIPAGDNPAQPVIGLPPRVTQPCRLQFRWISATSDLTEMNSDPASSPIFGWVLFNHLDDSLMIYDALGTMLGSFNVQGPFWQGAPGDAVTYDMPIAEVFANANPHLAAFALGVAANPNPSAFLADLLAAIDRTATMIEPGSYQEDQGLAVLIGRPLALVRASLGLELEGLPAINQSWDAFAAAVNSGSVEDRDDGGLTSVRFPVRLGDLSQVNDGLIGYFIENGAASGYATFYAAASVQTSHGVVPPAFDQLTVTGDENAPPTLLTVMVDPRAVVHATAGILPVKSIGIPPAMYSAALAGMAVTFLTAPVLASVASFSLPVPKESGYSWLWVTNNAPASTWDVTAPIKDAGSQDAFAGLPQQISEGWLKLDQISNPTEQSTSNDIR